MNDFLGLQYVHRWYFHKSGEELPRTEWETRLKRHALIFDKIGIFDIETTEHNWPDVIYWLMDEEVLFKARNTLEDDFWSKNLSEAKVYASELEKWMSASEQMDQGFIERRRLLEKLKSDISKLRSNLSKADKKLEKVGNSLKSAENAASAKQIQVIEKQLLALKKQNSELDKSIDETNLSLNKLDLSMAHEVQQIEQGLSIPLRMVAKQMEYLDGTTVTPLLPLADYLTNIPTGRRSDVIEIVIRNLPLPSSTTSWEAILDYRSDSGTQKSLRALRNWMRKIASKELPKNEIEEELESLMDEFDSYMKLHKLKANTEVLQTVIKAPLDIIQNLLVKPSNLIDPLFAFKKRQISLMEAEINAPGKEIAYIIKTNETFNESD